MVSAPDQPNLVDPRLPGAVYTFTRYYGPWAEREMLLHEPVTQPEFDYPVRFGERVALSGSRLLVDSGMPIASPPRDPPLVTLYERHDQQWQARAQLGCLDIQDVLIAGNAAFLTYGDYSKPGVFVVPYVLPPLGTAPPPTSFACE